MPWDLHKKHRMKIYSWFKHIFMGKKNYLDFIVVCKFIKQDQIIVARFYDYFGKL